MSLVQEWIPLFRDRCGFFDSKGFGSARVIWSSSGSLNTIRTQ